MAFATRFTFFLALCTLVPLTPASTSTRCSFDKIADDVAQISAKTLALDKYVQTVNYRDPGKQVAKRVHADFQGITDSIDTTSHDMKPCPGPFTEDIFQKLLSSVRTIIGEESKAMHNVVDKKPVFDAVGGVSSIIKQDLDCLHTSSVALENLWLERSPADLKGEAQKLVNEINNVLAFAQAAYAYA